MKKNELKNGDIIMLREGELGLYLAEQDVFIYQEYGCDYLETEFDDELANPYEEPDFDVMRVYREPFGNVISFFDYEEGELIFERDKNWERPGKEEREAARAARAAEHEALMAERQAERENAPKPQLMRIMVQGFYGNRTITKIEPEGFDEFIRGGLDTERENIDRTIIRVPGTENLVIVYNRYRENEAIERLREFIQTLRGKESRFNPTAVIPELGIVLYSRCVACRMNKEGELQSLEEGDEEKLLKYLAQ